MQIIGELGVIHVNLSPFREGVNGHRLREVPGGIVTEHDGVCFNDPRNGVSARTQTD